MPLFNESRRLARLEQGLRDFMAECRTLSFEVILVNDGSADDTAARLAELRPRLLAAQTDNLANIRIVDLPHNVGKGGALKAGVEAARGSWILTLDADISTAPGEVLRWQEYDPSLDLSKAPETPRIYIGAREHPDARIQDSFFRHIIGRKFNMMVQCLTGLDFDDTQCGFKLYPAEIARRVFGALRDPGWAHDVEILRRLTAEGVAICELPVTWAAVEGGSIRCWVDGPRMLMAVVKMRLHDLRTGGLSSIQRRDRLWQGAGVALLGFLLLMTLLCFRDYGAAWDETMQNQYGEFVLRFYSSHGHDTSALTHWNWRYYGGLFDGTAAWLQHRLPWAIYDTRHLLNGLVGWLGLLGAWKLVRFLAGPRAAVLTLCLLATEPSFMGHLFINPKDIPLATGYVWSIYYLVRCIGRFPGIPNGLILKAGLAFGLTLSFRVGGALVVGYLLLAALFYLARPSGFSLYPDGRPNRRFVPLLRSLVWIGALTYLIMLAFWPWALMHPLTGPIEALREISKFGGWSGPILLAGKEYYATNLPIYYLPLYFLVKLPELLLIGLGLAAGLALRRCRATAADPDPVLTRRWIFVALAMIFPVLYAVLTRAVLYDTHRHFLFVVPLICVVAGAAFDRLWSWLYTSRRAMGIGIAALGVVLAIDTAVTLVRLHPYEYVYYNHLVGGARGAANRYELDYWGTSYREAVERLVAYVKRTEPARSATTIYRVTVFGPRDCATPYLPPNFVLTTRVREADFYISFTRFRGNTVVRGGTIASVSRLGVELAVVKDLRQTPPDQRLPAWWSELPADGSPQPFSPP